MSFTSHDFDERMEGIRRNGSRSQEFGEGPRVPKIRSAMEETGFVEVTEWFRNQCSKLPLGKLVKSETMFLVEAMAAVEVMAPKIDPGMRLPQDQRIPKLDAQFVRSLTSASENRYALMGVMMRAMSNLIRGRGMASSLFGCVFATYPTSIVDQHLRLVVNAAIRTASRMHTIVMSSGENLDDYVVDGDLFNEIIDQNKQIEQDDEFDSMLRSSLSKSLFGCPFARAFLYLLETLVLLNSMDEEEEKNNVLLKSLQDVCEFSEHDLVYNSKLEALKETLEYARESVVRFQNCLCEISRMIGYHPDVYLVGFSATMHRKRFPASPPQMYELPEIVESMEEWKMFALGLEVISRLNPHQSPEKLLNTLEHCVHELRFECILRGIMLRVVLSQNFIFGYPVQKWILMWFNQSTEANFHLESKTTSGFVKTFLKLFSNLVLRLVKLSYCASGRQRRMAINLFQDMDSCQQKIEQLDTQIHLLSSVWKKVKPFFFTTFCVGIKLDLMIKVIKWGFQQSLYAPFEFASVYRYFSLLLGYQMEQQTRVSICKHYSKACLDGREIPDWVDFTEEEEFDKLYPPEPMLLYLSACRKICLGLFLICISSKKYHSNDPIKYLQRFHHFKTNHPKFFHFKNFQENVMECSKNTVYIQASTQFEKARCIVADLIKIPSIELKLNMENEQCLTTLKNLIRTCIHNKIFVDKLVKTPFIDFYPEFLYSKCFAVFNSK